jgi:hypothetical protein
MPRKTFTANEVLTAADTNLYLSNEITLVSSTATTYTVVAGDRYETLVFNNATAGTITIGTATAFQAGERVDIIRDGTATLRIARDGTATTLAGGGTAGTAYNVAQQYGAVSVVCVGTNSYRIIGNLTVA